MRLAVWPVAPARALGSALADLVTEIVEVEPHQARAALDEGRVDLALVPTLDVLRGHDGLSVVPGVALAGERSPRRRLVVGSPLDAIESVGFDPRDAQEAILTQMMLREHYDAAPTFALAPAGTPLADVLRQRSAALVDYADDLPFETFALDPGQEWTDLTLRPFPWGLLAGPVGTIPAKAAERIRATVQATPPTEALVQDGVGVYQLTLDGYALDGLDQFAEMLFATGTLSDIPAVPFVEVGEE